MGYNNRFEKDFFEPINKIIDELFPKDLQDWANKKFSSFGIYIPAANIVETMDQYELEMTVPGRSKKEFSIQFTNGKLIISADRKSLPDLDEDESYMRKEFAYPDIHRRFFFPRNTIQIESIKASYKNGILKVILPKLPIHKQPKEKKIKVD